MNKPLSSGFDHMESMGGRDRYVRRMLSHQRQMAAVKPVITVEERTPVAAFGGGRRRTPAKVDKGLKDDFVEVREAWEPRNSRASPQ